MTKPPIKLYISNTKTILHGQKQSWETIQIRCDQLTGTTWLVKIAMRARIEWSQAYQMRLGFVALIIDHRHWVWWTFRSRP